MKNLIITPILALVLSVFTGGNPLKAQNSSDDYLGLPGDNLNLFAVMDLFRESETLEGFERKLNDPELMINNLDLNGDNLVDYIMVFDYVDNDVHSIVLRVALNKNEYQDVAVFTVWKLRDGSAQVQLVGDEALYGPDYIVEPVYAETPNPGYRGAARSNRVNVVHTTYHEVASWPLIVYVYHPGYTVWHSSWYWGYYPTYWSPWRPHFWHYYYGYHFHWHDHYFTYYRPWRHHRHHHYHRHYYTHVRHYSPRITVMVNNGSYKNTYSRPETRKEGVVYAQRNSRGSSLPAYSNGRGQGRGNNGQEAEVRSRSANERQSSTINERTVNSAKARGNSQAVRRTESNRKNSEAVQRSAAPERENSRAVSRSSSERRRESNNVAPAREPERRQTQPARVKRSESSSGNNRSSSTRVRSSENRKSSAPTVRSSSSRRSESSVRSSSRNSGSRNQGTSNSSRGSNNRSSKRK